MELQMIKSWFSRSFVVGFVAFVVLPSIASAQSTISGVVKDSSGAVMKGVSVEAASASLIEGSRTATTDAEGRYTVVDVRPGVYTITFTMEGFSKIEEHVTVPASVSVPVDAEMKVGSIQEIVEVRATATVDVENVAHPEVLSRADMDAIPTARNMQSIGSYAPGVHLNTPDVGGSMQIQQTYISAHGNPPGTNSYLLDGMLINSTQSDGQVQTYVDNEIIQEASYQTSGMMADVSAGGVLTSMVPKDGGNRLHGDLFLGWVNSSFVGSNIDQALIARGVVGQSTVNQIQDFDGSFGGPISKDKLWFLVTGRKQVSNLESPNSFNSNGTPGIEYDHIYTGTARLTWQMDPKNKFSAMWTRDWKTINDDIVSSVNTLLGAGGYNDTNPVISSLRRDPVMFYILQGRWTGTLWPRLLLQAGFSLNKEDYDVTYQQGIQQVPFTPAWYAEASEVDLTKLTRSVAGAVNNYNKFDRYVWNATGAYVTGSHQISFGIQDSFGPAHQNSIANGDAYYNYTDGVPLSVTAFNTPSYNNSRLDADLGIYAQDSWHFKGLAVTAGLRWEYLSAQVDPESAPAGRFVPARNFAKVDCDTVKGLGCFKDWAPRLGAVYDLFGDHKTALKAGFGKFDTPIVSSVLNNFNPMALASESIAWVNAPTTACQSSGCFPAGTGFANGNIGANPNPLFGLPQNRTLDPNFHRAYSLQYNAGIQQEVIRGVALNFNWYRLATYQQILLQNSAVPSSAWTPVQIANPLDGTPITIYNLQPSYFGLTPQVYETNSRQSSRSDTYNGFETSAVARLPRGAFVFAAWTIDRQLDKDCDMTAGANLLNDPNSLRFCDWTGGLYQDLGKITGIPYRNEFKINGNVPLKWGIQASASLYSNPVFSTNFATNIATNTTNAVYSPLAAFAGQQAGFSAVNWTITSATTYPLDCNCPNPGGLVDPGLKQGSEVIPLIAPGSRLTPRLNQFDLGFRRVFHIREHLTISGEATIFNVFNANTVLTESYALGTSVKPYMAGGPGGQPSVIENPRMLRLSTQFKW
jgi:hypothetical protein